MGHGGGKWVLALLASLSPSSRNRFQQAAPPPPVSGHLQPESELSCFLSLFFLCPFHISCFIFYITPIRYRERRMESHMCWVSSMYQMECWTLSISDFITSSQHHCEVILTLKGLSWIQGGLLLFSCILSSHPIYPAQPWPEVVSCWGVSYKPECSEISLSSTHWSLHNPKAHKLRVICPQWIWGSNGSEMKLWLCLLTVWFCASHLT